MPPAPLKVRIFPLPDDKKKKKKNTCRALLGLIRGHWRPYPMENGTVVITGTDKRIKEVLLKQTAPYVLVGFQQEKYLVRFRKHGCLG